jgi:hypothetical protein
VPLSYWLHLGFKGSVVGLFELDRREVAERAVEPAVVVPVDPSGGGVLDVSEALCRARRGRRRCRRIQAAECARELPRMTSIHRA